MLSQVYEGHEIKNVVDIKLGIDMRLYAGDIDRCEIMPILWRTKGR